MKSKFITLEGIDGAGKSTHLDWLAETIRQGGHKVVITREPGGTPLGEMLRDILLGQPMDIETEALLMFASRREHLAKVILPALHEGKWVISDRFTDATFAYQGGGRGLSESRLEVLETWVHQGFQPDMTLLFDVPLEVSHERLSLNTSLDRFEREKLDFFDRVRRAYLQRASQFPERIRVVDSSRSIPAIQTELKSLLAPLLQP